MIKRFLQILAFTATASLIAAEPIELPDPPEGYSWKQSDEVTFALLCPSDWHFKQANQKGVVGLFVSKEKIEGKGIYETGIMVNITRNAKEKTGLKPSDFIRAYALGMSKKAEIIDQWEKEMGPFKNISNVSLTHYKNTPPLKQHLVLIANDSTGTVYLINFETLPELWEENWKIAEPIMKKLYLDSDV